jgi:hypothetical protein
MKQTDLRDMFKKASNINCVASLTACILLHNFYAMKTPESMEEDSDDPEPADEDIQMEYSSD